MPRFPLIPTAIVALCIAAMIGLGLWQLNIRLPQKEAQLAHLADNPSKPEMAFPSLPDDSLLFRKAQGFCLEPVGSELIGAGKEGFRLIVECRTGGLEGPGMLVQLGTTRDPNAKLDWKGGTVHGTIAYAPDARSMLASLNDKGPKRLMLVAETPPQGLSANTPPKTDGVPNNHLAYAVQWFLFAAVAAIIYLLALKWRANRAV